jgi:ABC-type antimicrobial peptide transport system permease subunit
MLGLRLLPSIGPALTGLAVTLAIRVLGGLVPAWQAARADIVSSLRHS